jgi:hypothetical protein
MWNAWFISQIILVADVLYYFLKKKNLLMKGFLVVLLLGTGLLTERTKSFVLSSLEEHDLIIDIKPNFTKNLSVQIWLVLT